MAKVLTSVALPLEPVTARGKSLTPEHGASVTYRVTTFTFPALPRYPFIDQPSRMDNTSVSCTSTILAGIRTRVAKLGVVRQAND